MMKVSLLKMKMMKVKIENKRNNSGNLIKRKTKQNKTNNSISYGIYRYESYINFAETAISESNFVKQTEESSEDNKK